MGRPDLADDPRFARNDDRLANLDEFVALVEAWMATFDTDEQVLAGYLFGSVARGEDTHRSDVDVAILLRTVIPGRLDDVRSSLEAAIERSLHRRAQVVVLNSAPPDLVHRVLRDSLLLLDGALTWDDRLDLVLVGLSQIAIRWPEARLLILGQGPLRPILERLAERLGIADRVRFLPRLTWAERPLLHRVATALIRPSRVMEVPWALLDAMAQGLPVAASNPRSRG